MNRRAKGSGFKMRSGNSPLKAGDAGIIAAATPDQTIEPIDFTIEAPEIDIEEEDDNKGKKKKKKGKYKFKRSKKTNKKGETIHTGGFGITK
tara:strand:+ start:276 stop:551 length:276 start_codon:yes stop_codon:yes gene_type:complete